MSLKAASKTFMLLGECIPCVKANASKFKVKRLLLDENLLAYFNQFDYVYAHDPEKKCKTGDIALIEVLPNKLTTLITHRVKEIIYPLGDTTDPLTGKKVVASKYREHIDKVNEAFGKRPSIFKYDEAPKRGWQEDKKDFSHVENYYKYHEDGKDQPYSV